jgi:hypothetical protein
MCSGAETGKKKRNERERRFNQARPVLAHYLYFEFHIKEKEEVLHSSPALHSRGTEKEHTLELKKKKARSKKE